MKKIILKITSVFNKLKIFAKKIDQLDALLIFLTIFSITLVAFRIMKTGEHTYIFMFWNLFLAAVPLFLSRFVIAPFSRRKAGISIYGFFFLWLMFLPNAPYIITDFVHLMESDSIPLWYDLLLVAFFAWEGFLLGFMSVAEMEEIVTRMYSALAGKWFALISLVLSSLGVYMGRFLRYNSWDIFISPVEIITNVGSRILNPRAYPGLYGMIIILSVLLITLYGFYRKVGSAVHTNPARIQNPPMDSVINPKPSA
jgi:uncharacterized membrane protein